MKHEMFVTLADVQEAALRLDPVINQTMAATSRSLTEHVGVDLTLKCEQFQRTGSMSFRGAANAVRQLTSDQLERGLITHAPGNFAIALAQAANDVKAKAIVVVPDDITDYKRAFLTSLGCELVTYDRFHDNPATKTAELASDHNYTLIPPSDHPHVVAGLATAALELFDECGAFDAVIVPVNGGASIASIGTVARALYPDITVIGVEPESGNDTQQALRTRKRSHVDPPETIADELTNTAPNPMTLNMCQGLVKDIYTVSDEDIVRAMAFLFDKLKCIVEPSAATVVAALLSESIPALPGRTAVFLTSGNIGHQLFSQHLHDYGVYSPTS